MAGNDIFGKRGEMTEGMKEAAEYSGRKEYLDVLRGLAAIGVIFIHVSANNWYGYIGSGQWTIFTIYEGFFKASVLIFFEISGVLYLNSKREKTLKDLYIRSVGRLLLFLLFWALVYKMVRLPWSGGSFSDNLRNACIEIFTGNTETHLWFLYAIIGLYVLVPVLRPIVHGASRSQLKYAVAVFFVFGSVCEMLGMFPDFAVIANNLNKIRAGMSFGYVGCFLLGAYLDQYEVEKKNRILLYILGIFGTISTMILVYWDCVSSQMIRERFWAYTMPNVYVSGAAVFLFFKNLRVRNIFTKVMCKISDRSLGIYGVHFLFILLFWKTGFDTFLFTGILSVPVISIIILILSYILSSVLHRIPKIGKYIA